MANIKSQVCIYTSQYPAIYDNTLLFYFGGFHLNGYLISSILSHQPSKNKSWLEILVLKTPYLTIYHCYI